MKKFALLCLALASLAACVQDPEIESNVPVFSDESLSAAPQSHSVILSAAYTGSDASSITGCGFKLGKDVSLSDGKEYPSLEVANHTLQLEISGLDADQTYYYQAFARNGSGLVCSAVRSFKTLAEALPPAPGEKPSFLYLVNSRNEVQDVAFKAKLKTTEGYDILKVGLCYNKTGQPTTSDSNVVAALDEEQVMTVHLTTLDPETQYTFRAYAEIFSDTAGKETVYSDPETLTTLATPPVNPTAWIDFVDPYARQACLARYDFDKDGGVSYAEAAEAVSMDSLFEDYTGVASFDEIQYFTSITSLKKTFRNCSNLQSITLPDGITDITSTFVNCTSLQQVTLPDGLEIIQGGAFYGCSSLQQINVPSALKEIHDQAFDGCTSLTNFTFPASLKKICCYSFHNAALSTIILPEGLETIGGNAFNGVASATEINIPSTVTGIGGYAFRQTGGKLTIACNLSSATAAEYFGASGTIGGSGGCRIFYGNTFNEIVFAEGVTTIPAELCKDWTSLQTYHFPSTLTTIGDSAFSGSGLQVVDLPGTITSLGKSVFAGCQSLEQIIVREGITALPEKTFNFCQHVQTVQLPTTLLTIGSEAFYYTTGTANLSSDMNIDSSNKGFYGAHFTSVHIDEGVTHISGSFFADCDKLTSVSIPSTLTYIGNEAFYSCTLLSDIQLPSQLEYIGTHAFKYCSSLSNIEIPASVTSLGSGIFDGAAGDTAGSCLTIRCPLPSVASQSVAPFANSYFYKVVLAEGITSVGNYALCSLNGTGELVLPSTLQTIGDYGFLYCRATSVTFPNGLTTLGTGAFMNNCLVRIEVPASVHTISEYCFSGTHATEVILHEGLVSIKSSAFSGQIFTSLTVPSTVQEIGQYSMPYDYLTTYRLLPVTPPAYSGLENSWKTVKDELQILVPASSLAAYKAAWSTYYIKDHIYADTL